MRNPNPRYFSKTNAICHYCDKPGKKLQEVRPKPNMVYDFIPWLACPTCFLRIKTIEYTPKDSTLFGADSCIDCRSRNDCWLAKGQSRLVLFHQRCDDWKT